MIDTIRLQWPGPNMGAELNAWLLEEYKTPEFHTRWYDENQPWEGVTVRDDAFGTIGLKSNRRGNYLWVETSLPKFMYGDNCRLLSVEEAREGVAALASGVEQRFSRWNVWGDALRSGLQVKRVDLCYQRKVSGSGEVFAHLARCLKQRKVALHLGGVELHQSRFEHVRWYDKGLESGNEKYLDVVRHEEQLRGGKAAWLVDASGPLPVLRVDEAREKMNERYEGWGVVEGYDLADVLAERKMGALAAFALVKNPEFDQMARQHLPSSTYYKVRSLVLEVQRRRFTTDLRLPADAWQEPMVL